MKINLEISPKAKYQYIEYNKNGTYVWFSDQKFRGYIEMTKEDLDEECNLNLLGFNKIFFELDNLFERTK